MILHGLNRIRRGYGLCGVLLVASLSGTVVAQSAPSDMLFEPALNVVLDAPFTVTVEWTSTENAVGGSPIYHRRVSRILRDSRGRQRFEDGPDEAGPQAGNSPTVRLYNPAKRMFASLDAQSGVAKISTMGASVAAPAKAVSTAATTQLGDSSGDAAQAKDKDHGATRVALPPRDIVGLHAEGVRTTTTIPGGRDGSAGYTITDDVWTSPEWTMPLLHIHADSRGASSQAQVTSLDRTEPDAALMQPPMGYKEDHWEVANRFSVVLPKVSPLPAPILDDDLAKAANRMLASATAHTEDLRAPYHQRYDLTMIDYRGQKHSGSVESWINNSGRRTEIHTDTYSSVRVTDFENNRMWERSEGIEPLRVQEFVWDELYPTHIQQSLLHPTTVQAGKSQAGDTIPRLSAETVGEAQLTCASNQAQAKMCFDLATGFLVAGRFKSERVDYEGWQKIGMKYREQTLRILQDTNLLVEAKLTLATDSASTDEILKNISELHEILPADESSSVPQHRILGQIPSETPPSSAIHGSAQVRVTVDEKGKVVHAEIEDADDEQVAAAALERARGTIYAPYLVGGRATGFDTTAVITLDTNKGSSR